jgi:hypothetical protein
MALPPKAADGVVAPPAAPAHTDARGEILSSINREAPIEQWQRGPSFKDGESCEDARIAAINDFDAAMRGVDGRRVPDPARPRLTSLAQAALGRCVLEEFAPSR